MSVQCKKAAKIESIAILQLDVAVFTTLNSYNHNATSLRQIVAEWKQCKASEYLFAMLLYVVTVLEYIQTWIFTLMNVANPSKLYLHFTLWMRFKKMNRKRSPAKNQWNFTMRRQVQKLLEEDLNVSLKSRSRHS